MTVKGINYDHEVATGLFDPRCNDDTTVSPWMRIVSSNYREQQMTEAELLAYKRIKRQKREELEEKMEEIESDPMLKYLYETEQDQRRYTKRLMRDAGRRKPLGLAATSSYETVLRYVKGNWDNSRMPVIINKTNTIDEEGGTKRMTFRQALRSTRSSRQAREERQIELNAESGNLKLKEFPAEFIAKVKQSRANQKMTQAELALKVSRKEAEIAEFERGDAAFNRPLMALLTWALGLQQ